MFTLKELLVIGKTGVTVTFVIIRSGILASLTASPASKIPLPQFALLHHGSGSPLTEVLKFFAVFCRIFNTWSGVM